MILKSLKIMIIGVMVLLISITSIFAKSAALVGPVWTGESGSEKIFDNFALHVGYAVSAPLGTWTTASVEFGSRAEAQLEVIKLFPLSQKLSVGVSAGGGVNYADSGLTVAEMLFGSGGLVATWDFSDKIGSWLIYESRTEEKPKLGFGLFYQI